MSTQARIYAVTNATVTDPTGQKVTLVKATNQAQALRHVARHAFAVRVATALEVADQMADGAGGRSE